MSDNPRQFPIVFKNVRRALLRRFPYSLFFVVEGDDLTVIACFHASGPEAKMYYSSSISFPQWKGFQAATAMSWRMAARCGTDDRFASSVSYFFASLPVGVGRAILPAAANSWRLLRLTNEVIREWRRLRTRSAFRRSTRKGKAGCCSMISTNLYRSGATVSAITNLLKKEGKAKAVRLLTLTSP